MGNTNVSGYGVSWLGKTTLYLALLQEPLLVSTPDSTSPFLYQEAGLVYQEEGVWTRCQS